MYVLNVVRPAHPTYECLVTRSGSSGNLCEAVKLHTVEK